MAYYDRDYFQEEEPQRRFTQTPSVGPLSKALLIALGVLVIASIPIADSMDAGGVLSKDPSRELLRMLALSWHAVWPAEGYALSPWQVVTAPLIPADILSAILTGVLGLWLFGCRLEQVLGRRRYGVFLLLAMLLPGIASALVDPLLCEVWTGSREVYSLGTGSLTVAIYMGVAAAYPDGMSFFGLRFVTVSLILVGIAALIAMWGYTGEVSGVRVVSSLPGMAAGAAFGWYGVKWMAARGMVKTVRTAHKKAEGPEDYLAYARKLRGEELAAGGAEAKSPATSRRERESKRAAKETQRLEEEQQAVDALLARISAEGINSLSKGERAFLERVSKRKRGESL